MKSFPPVPCVVFSLARERSGRLLRDARRTQLLPPVVNSWGTLPAYGELLTRRPPPLAVLDVPDEDCAYELPHRVALLRRLAPVTVLAPAGVSPAALLEAGAENVLDRSMPVEELAARLKADQRWIAREAEHKRYGAPGIPPHLLPPQATQRVLVSLILADPHPWCCHDLTRLLGSAEQPLTRAALRARMPRLGPHLARLGLELHRTGGWGRFSYLVVPSASAERGHAA
ncbi:hypothetical protein [Streptomyces fulvoviolaceus]|uniref:hypothetical protein n=1 Tax=Streptomyces fulvoviolaceus TaxID=285535 RepID=UPI0021C1FFD8|nr:hypothetical protein [Streptomyces fulvoviolaceus]MCT9075108.1 hypothetical protein [Streptomyces fulvoviolaceus]